MAGYLAWKGGSGAYFGTIDASIEMLQPPRTEDISPYELIETSYFGFNIPEHNINGEIYFYMHPKLRVASGGIIIYRGILCGPAFAECHSWRHFMPLPDDITDCTYANGVSIRMTVPQARFEISFDDPTSDTALELQLDAIMPAAPRPGGGHITQAMRTSGSLRLRGENFKIDGYFTRDRSWGDPRSEATQDIPPISWIVPVFDDDLALHIMAFDSPELVKGWSERYPSIAGGKNLLWGYVWRDGQLLGVKSCKKRTVRSEEDGIRPLSMELEIVDETDRLYRLKGRVVALTPVSPWANSVCFLCQVEWSLDGRKGYGDLQEATYPQVLSESQNSTKFGFGAARELAA